MVEATINTAKPKVKVTNERPREKPKSIYSWTVNDVQKWLRRHCEDLFQQYNYLFLKNHITGRTLLRINDNSLLRLGVKEQNHRGAICREIVKLKLKTDIMEIRDLQYKNKNVQHLDLNSLI